MQTIYDVILKIINKVNRLNLYKKRFKNSPKDWNMLCSAMDTIEDTCEAGLYFEKRGLGETVGGKYLKLYGLLQSIYVQQDSIKVLHKIFINKKLIDNIYQGWRIIRNLRNMTVGHPVCYDYGEKSVFLSRVTISNKGFQLLVNKNTSPINSTHFINVDLLKYYKNYIKETVNILNVVLDRIN